MTALDSFIENIIESDIDLSGVAGNFENNDVYSMFIYKSVNGSLIETPIAIDTIRSTYGKVKETVILPLTISPITCSHKSTAKMFTEVKASGVLTKVKDSKEKVYYIGFGIILNSDKTPVIYVSKIVDTKKNRIYHRIYVHPYVFLSSDSIEKFIRKYIFDLACRYEVLITPKINNLVHKVTVPDYINNEEFNKCLSDNIEKVLTAINL